MFIVLQQFVENHSVGICLAELQSIEHHDCRLQSKLKAAHAFLTAVDNSNDAIEIADENHQIQASSMTCPFTAVLYNGVEKLECGRPEIRWLVSKCLILIAIFILRQQSLAQKKQRIRLHNLIFHLQNTSVVL